MLEKKRVRTLPCDFYGKIKGVFGEGHVYQKKLRNEWS